MLANTIVFIEVNYNFQPSVSNLVHDIETSTDLTIISVASSTSVDKTIIRPHFTTETPEVLPGADIFDEEGSGDDVIITNGIIQVRFYYKINTLL